MDAAHPLVPRCSLMNASGGVDGSTLAAALVEEIRVEMARKRIGSVAELARRMGWNQSKLNERMNRSRSGGRVPIGVEDLAEIAAGLDMDPLRLMQRAVETAAQQPSADEQETAARMASEARRTRDSRRKPPQRSHPPRSASGP